MSRIDPVAGSGVPLLLRLLNAASRRTIGAEVVPLQVMAHNPGFLLPYLATLRFVRGRTELDSTVRALAMQRVAGINGCAWCLDFGRAEAEKGGVSAAKLLAVADHATSPLFSPAERAAVAYAEAATEVGARVPDVVFDLLHCYFSDREIVELTVAIATENFYNRINAPLEIEAQGFCAAPPRPAIAASAA